MPAPIASATKSLNTPIKIAAVDITSDRLTSRAGLSLWARYLTSTGILDELEASFAELRKTATGLPVRTLFKQILCFLCDGTSRHLVHFDRLARQDGYATTIETPGDEMASSHQIKRFFGAFGSTSSPLFRALLRRLALWRIAQANPEVIVLGLDSMVLDNGEARQREGVEPTYKKVFGLHPLQLTWDRFIVDALLRPGSQHCNHGEQAYEMIKAMVEALRAQGLKQPIIVRLDAGFHDQDLMKQLTELGVGYLMGGRLYAKTRCVRELLPEAFWHTYQKGSCAWRYADYLNLRPTWKHARRVLYCYTLARDGQYELPLDETTESLIYTNLIDKTPLAESFHRAGLSSYLESEPLLALYHGRGCDELVHRHLKDFWAEEMPFKSLLKNTAFYYCLLVAFFLHETFKSDVTCEVLPERAFSTTLRRVVLDVAGKLVCSKGRLVLKVTRACWDQLQFGRLWQRANAPPRLC